MTGLLNPAAVQDALDKMDAGEASEDVLAVLVLAAEEYAAMKPEWGFSSSVPGMDYVTRNDMLIETMTAAKPEEPVLVRFAPDWRKEQTDER